jgi:hypothetical protein
LCAPFLLRYDVIPFWLRRVRDHLRVEPYRVGTEAADDDRLDFSELPRIDLQPQSEDDRLTLLLDDGLRDRGAALRVDRSRWKSSSPAVGPEAVSELDDLWCSR